VHARAKLSGYKVPITRPPRRRTCSRSSAYSRRSFLWFMRISSRSSSSCNRCPAAGWGASIDRRAPRNPAGARNAQTHNKGGPETSGREPGKTD
jgi:hypothetical protein